ncbi:unnamed protein product [Hymenolepis diminuta]|uniref:Uncharacterized protein n=1 Tax=Hymenolepis diminuta TaxID=6216 RepID=A0A564Z935_HYMDI|nr:unnamed protein product [Hymenolepis diminuta]
MNAVEKDNRELAEISIVLSPFSPTQHQSSTATVAESTAAAITTTTSPASVQTPITGNLISIPMHLAPSRMVCLRATTQDCLSVTQTICPITSSPEAVTASIGHPIFISTSPNPTITPAPPSTAYSTSSNGSAFLGSDGDKISLDGRRKRPAPSIASARQNTLDTTNIISPKKVRTSREIS